MDDTSTQDAAEASEDCSPDGKKSESARTSTTEKWNKDTCHGCYRTKGVSYDFVHLTELVQWQGSYGWCRDCYNLHRTLYATSHSLTLFAIYLQDGRKRAVWETQLAAYLSLKREGTGRIRANQVNERHAALEFMLRLLCLPAEPFVTELFSHTSLQGLDRHVVSRRLATIRGPDGDRLAMWTPSVDMAPAAAMPRPQYGHEPFLRSRLSVTFAPDRQMFEQHFLRKPLLGQSSSGTECNEQAIVVHQGEDADTGMVPSRATKLNAKYEAHVMVSTSILAGFAMADWQALMKESKFTKILSGFHSLHTEALTVGNVYVLDGTTEWKLGLQHGKNFVASLREYVKAKHKYERLAIIHSPLTNFNAFMRSHKFKVAPTFQLLVLKVEVFNAVESREGLRVMADALTKCVDDGLCTCFGGPTTTEATDVSPDVWLRGLLFQGFKLLLESAEGLDAADCKLNINDDVHKVLSQLRERTRFDPSAVDKLIADLDALATYWKCSLNPESTAPSAIDKARERLASTRMSPVFDAMKSSDLGKEVLEQAADRMVRSSQDTIADQKLEDAIGSLVDDRIPHVVSLDDDTQVVLNFSLVRDGSLVSIVQESIDGVAEAYTLWSGARAEESGPRVVDWSRDVRAKLEIIDVALTVSLWASLVNGGIGSVIGSDLATIDDSMGNDALWVHVAAMCTSCKDAAINESAYDALLAEAIPSFIEGLGALLPPGFEASYVLKLKNNSAARSTIGSVFDQLFNFVRAFTPETIAEYVDEFKLQASRGTPETSFAARALKLEQAQSALRTIATLGRSRLADQVVNIAMADGVEQILLFEPVRWQAALAMPAVIDALLNIVRRDHFASKDAGQILISDFFEAVALPTIQVNARVAATSDANVCDRIGRLVELKSTMPSIAAARRSFEKGATLTCNTLPCEASLSMAKDVLSTCTTDTVIRVKNNSVFLDADEYVAVDRASLFAMCSVYVCAHKLACVLLFLHTQLGTASGSVCDHAMRVDVKVAVESADACISSAEQQIKRLAAGEPTRWVLSATDINAWVNEVRSCMEHAKLHILKEHADDLEGLANSITKCTPIVHHFITDEKFMKAQAVKFRATWKGRSAFNDATVELYKSMQKLTATHAALGIERPLQDLHGDTIVLTRSVFDDAKNNQDLRLHQRHREYERRATDDGGGRLARRWPHGADEPQYAVAGAALDEAREAGEAGLMRTRGNRAPLGESVGLTWHHHQLGFAGLGEEK